jgi:hypothetical protein
MSFILSFEPHHNILQRVLNKAYVPQNMAYRTIEHLVERIHATNYMYFTEDKLDVGGTGHNKPLYITVRYKDYTIKKLFVDNGLNLNVLPKHVLDEMLVDSMHMLPSTMTVRAYNGSQGKWWGSLK